MSLQTYRQKRSIQSFLLEKFLRLRNTKKRFSSIENTTKYLKQIVTENIKPYSIGKAKFSSEITEQTIEDMQVFTLNDQKSSKQKVILYLHGGAWTNQPLVFHWKFMDELAQSLNAKIIAPIYPKVPNYSYQDTYPKLLDLYNDILGTVESSQQLTVMGDSSGGNIALGLTQLLKKDTIAQPKDIILLSACVDMKLDNPLIPVYEKKDPMLARGGMDVITTIWAADKKLDDPLISPIYGDLNGLGNISHFIGTHDSLYPDAKKFDEKLTMRGIEIHTYVYPKMDHVFVVMPIPEAKDAKRSITEIINKSAGV